jgi:hypothetical protein
MTLDETTNVIVTISVAANLAWCRLSNGDGWSFPPVLSSGCAIGWIGHTATRLMALERDAVPGVSIDDCQRTA